MIRMKRRPPRRCRRRSETETFSFVEDLQQELPGSRIVLARERRDGHPPHLRIGSGLCDRHQLLRCFRFSPRAIQSDQPHPQWTVGRRFVHSDEITDRDSRATDVGEGGGAEIEWLVLIPDDREQPALILRSANSCSRANRIELETRGLEARIYVSNVGAAVGTLVLCNAAERFRAERFAYVASLDDVSDRLPRARTLTTRERGDRGHPHRFVARAADDLLEGRDRFVARHAGEPP